MLLLVLVLVSTFTSTALAQKAATPHFSGQAAYNLTQQFIAAAPHRWIGSPDHLKAEEFIKSHFAPEIAKGNFETDSFSANTPAGRLDMRNYIVRFPGKKDGVIVLASHYETNYWLKDINFVGANDGAATTALLIEIGNYLRAHPPEGYSVWLVFDDGEEAIKSWSNSDSLYGTRHLAAKWSANGTLSKIKAFLLADMIGDKDLNIDQGCQLHSVAARSARSRPRKTLATPHPSSRTRLPFEDDHLPFKQRGVPVLDIIDLDYGPPTSERPEGGYHHTELDTLDKISPKSLQISGDLFLEMIRLINQRP